MTTAILLGIIIGLIYLLVSSHKSSSNVLVTSFDEFKEIKKSKKQLAKEWEETQQMWARISRSRKMPIQTLRSQSERYNMLGKSTFVSNTTQYGRTSKHGCLIGMNYGNRIYVV